MVKNFNIEVKGVRRAFRFLRKNELKIELASALGIKKGTELLEKEIKSSIRGIRAEPRSVDTRQFLNSVISTSTKDDGMVSSDVLHAAFLEFGTSRIPARRHFRNSADRNRKKIINIINTEIKKFI